MKVPYTKNIHNFFQGPPNPGFRSVKVQNRDFSQKGLTGFQKLFSFRVPMNPIASLESKIRRCPFFGVHNSKKQCVIEIKILLQKKIQSIVKGIYRKPL